VYVVAERGTDGLWRIVEEEVKHSHATKGGKGKGKASASSSSAASKQSLPTPPASKKLRLTAPPPANSTSASSLPLSSCSSQPSDFPSFLHLFLFSLELPQSSRTLTSLTSLLLSAGVSSTEDLVDPLCLDTGLAVEGFAAGLRMQGIREEEAKMVEGAVRKARQEIGLEKVESRR
jgi:hypothetical protein